MVDRDHGAGAAALSATASDAFGDFSSTSALLPISIVPVLPSDFTGDGFADMLLRSGLSGQLLFAAGNGQSYSGALTSLTGGLGNYIYGGHGDINGDGYADIVIQNPANGQFFVGFQNGSGMPTYQALALLPGWRPVGVGDINRDGYADILIQNQITGVVDYYDVHNGSIDAVRATPAGFSVVGVGDVNGDGYSRHRAAEPGHRLDRLHRHGRRRQFRRCLGGERRRWQVRAVGDLNGDGYADIVIQNLDDRPGGVRQHEGRRFQRLGRADDGAQPRLRRQGRGQRQ